MPDFFPSERLAHTLRSEHEISGWLNTIITVFGAAQVIFFVPAFLGALLRLQLSPALESLVRWGPGGAEQYEEMISIIYIIWGIYLIRAARSPFENMLFLDFSVAANVAHISIMTAMAFYNERDRVHLIGDVLAAWLVLGPFTYVWTLSKRKHRR
ncbi:hypothetical protein BDV23DRAFT_165723 [Aspergillus alliaceus]|nr:uncharacterized protein BDW43DRAFT_282604 [Aspergillus alliaceus]KAB8231543.1 hypothetical protein BDW43DRAFT_282604 [Aspergillus alliaceus]KAE8385050.1 hypothetical protein BDV23DRAFT_165723 [Aspergillus alliaceus]